LLARCASWLQTSLNWPAPPAHPFLASSLCQRAENLKVLSGAIRFRFSRRPVSGEAGLYSNAGPASTSFFRPPELFSQAFRGVDHLRVPQLNVAAFVGEAGVLRVPPAGVKLFFYRPELSSKPAGCLTFRPRREAARRGLYADRHRPSMEIRCGCKDSFPAASTRLTPPCQRAVKKAWSKNSSGAAHAADEALHRPASATAPSRSGLGLHTSLIQRLHSEGLIGQSFLPQTPHVHISGLQMPG